MVAGLEAAGGKVVNLPAKNNFRIMLKTGEIIRYIRNNNIELVHCHLPWAGFVAGSFISVQAFPLFIPNIINRALSYFNENDEPAHLQLAIQSDCCLR